MAEDTPALPPIREVIARHGLSASKALGQNFLLDEQLLGRIAAIPGDLEGARVLEVGPGPGGLTRALLRAGARVTAIEMDTRCLPALAELGESFPGQLTVIEGDAMKLDHGELMKGEPFHIASNLPYNVGTALLTRWLDPPEWPPFWESLTLMFQREVAERIVARPGTKAYGRLSILTEWRAEAAIVMDLPPQAFTPPPKVRSAVVHLKARPEPLYPANAKTLRDVVARAFQQRRKMLRASLKGYPDIEDKLESAGIDPKSRAETIDLERFCALARALET